jgi:hypothetical protein
LTAAIEPLPGASAGICLNCGASLVGPYCSACGQKQLDPAEPTWRVVRETVSEATDIDGRAFRTLRALVSPGQLTREHLRGRRVGYVGPLKLFLIVGAALSLTWALTRGVDERYYGFAANQSARAYIDTVVRGLLMASLAIAISSWMLSGRRRRFLDEAVFALHIVAAMSLWAVVVIWLGTAWKLAWETVDHVPSSVPSLVSLLFLPAGLAAAVYITAAIRGVYAIPWWAAALRALVFATLGIAAVLLAIMTRR